MINYLKNLDIFFESALDKKKQISKTQFVFFVSSIFELGGVFLLGPLIFIATSGEDSLSNGYVNLAYSYFGLNSFENFFLLVVIFTGFIIFLGGFISSYSVILLSRMG